MAELIVHNPPRAALKASGYIGSPEGDIELTENDKTYNVTSFASATVKIPEEEKTVTPSAVKQEITPDSGLLSKVTVLPASLEERTVTPTIVQQTITPEAPAIGLSKVTVGATLPPPILVSKQITENGTYTADDDNADGFSEVAVKVDDSSKVILAGYIEGTISDLESVAESVCDKAFYNVERLTSIDLPLATSIGQQSFYQCISLTSVNLPLAVTIGQQAFQDCALNSITLPSAVSIGMGAFAECRSLTCADLPLVVTIEPCFANCTSLTSVNLPLATSIGQNFFLYCSSLTSINLPSATSIGNFAFRYCAALTLINLPLATSIGAAFRDCVSLTTVVLGKRATLSSRAGINSQLVFYVKNEDLEWYSTATNWSYLYNNGQIKSVDELPSEGGAA